MTATFFFYLGRTLRNKARYRLRRLRQPKYLVSATVGLGYVYFTSLRFMFGGRARRPRPPALDPGFLPMLELGAAAALALLLVVPWIFPARRTSLGFKPAEIQFLFPAPLDRRRLLHFRLLKSQLAILFGVAVSGFIFGRARLVPDAAFLVADLWIVYTFLAIYRLGTEVVQVRRAKRGALLDSQAVVVAAFGVALGALALWVRSSGPPLPAEVDSGALVEWGAVLLGSGPFWYLLLPSRLLVRPALAADAVAFARALGPALGLVALAYLWVGSTGAGFEAAALEPAPAAAQARRPGTAGHGRAGRASSAVAPPWFRLAPAGPLFVVFFWKNLIAAAGRYRPRLVVLVAGGAAAAAVGVRLSGVPGVDVIIGFAGAIAGGLLAFFLVLGPVMQRDDLRADLLRIDLLKSYPAPGWAIVLGEVLAPASVLALTQWGLLAVAAMFLPGIEASAGERAAWALAAALVLPGFGLLGILVQNAAALLLPGWVQLGREHRQGIEAIGQRLIITAATLIVLLVAVLPAALVFGTCTLVGLPLLGPLVYPVAAAIAAVGLGLEAVLAVLWLGIRFERLDPSVEAEVLGPAG